MLKTNGMWRWGIANLFLLLAATVHAAAESAPVPVLEPATIDVDVTRLPRSEQAALVPILRAAREMDALYLQQVWPGTRALMVEREADRASAAQTELAALNFFKGPWGPKGGPFIAGVPFERPIGDFYPAGATKHDLDAWLAKLSAPERKRALDPYTVIESGKDGGFQTTAYSQHYREGLARASRALLEAAALTQEPTLKNFLTLRAKALLDDDYYASDVAFVGLKGPIDVVLAPYEVDDDGWFGVKTAFDASIALVNEPATQRIRQVSSRLQELEDHLPLAPELRGRKLGAAAPIVILDAIYQGGLSDAGRPALGYGLPNDLRALNAVGARTGAYSNILKLKYDATFKPIADAVLADADRSKLRFEDIRDMVTFIRAFDSLGPQFVTGTKQPIAEALRENAAVAAQVRSMLLSLWGHRYLTEHGYLDRRAAASLYGAFLTEAISRAGSPCAPCQGSTYILNHLIEARAVAAGADGRLKVDSAKADADIVRAAAEFISSMAKGDAAAVKSLLQHYAVATPTIREISARIGPPPLHRPVYVTADRMRATAH